MVKHQVYFVSSENAMPNLTKGDGGGPGKLDHGKLFNLVDQDFVITNFG